MTIREQTRRQFFQNAAGFSIGGAAFATLLQAGTSTAYTGLHYPAKAKRVIYL